MLNNYFSTLMNMMSLTKFVAVLVMLLLPFKCGHFKLPIGLLSGPSLLLRSLMRSTGHLISLLRRRKGMSCPEPRWWMLIWLELSIPMRYSQLSSQSRKRLRGLLSRRTHSKISMLCWSSTHMPPLPRGWLYWLRHNGPRKRKRSWIRRDLRSPRYTVLISCPGFYLKKDVCYIFLIFAKVILFEVCSICRFYTFHIFWCVVSYWTFSQ